MSGNPRGGTQASSRFPGNSAGLWAGSPGMVPGNSFYTKIKIGIQASMPGERTGWFLGPSQVTWEFWMPEFHLSSGRKHCIGVTKSTLRTAAFSRHNNIQNKLQL